MEPLTHLMAGALVGHAFAGFHLEPTVSLTAMAMATIPDFDYFSRALPGAVFIKTHHGITHSIFGIGALAICTAAFFHFSGMLLGFRAPFLFLAFVGFISGLTHILLDGLMHNNGLPLFWPISPRRYSLPLILGVNPRTVSRHCGDKKLLTCFGCQFRGSLRNPISWIITLGGIVGFIAVHHRPAVVGITSMLCALYFLFIYRMRNRAIQAVHNFDPEFDNADIYPGRARPDRWLFVKNAPNDAVHAVLVDSTARAILRKWRFPPPLLSPFVRNHTQRIFDDLKYAVKHLYPEARIQDDQTIIHFRDLSFLYAEPLEIGSIHVRLDKDGKIISEIFQEVLF